MKGNLLAHKLDPFLINWSFSYSVNHLFLLNLLTGVSYFQVFFGWCNVGCPMWGFHTIYLSAALTVLPAEDLALISTSLISHRLSSSISGQG